MTEQNIASKEITSERARSQGPCSHFRSNFRRNSLLFAASVFSPQVIESFPGASEQGLPKANRWRGNNHGNCRRIFRKGL